MKKLIVQIMNNIFNEHFCYYCIYNEGHFEWMQFVTREPLVALINHNVVVDDTFAYFTL